MGLTEKKAFRRGNSAPATPPLRFPDGTLNINIIEYVKQII
jgi:hypothetical protein